VAGDKTVVRIYEHKSPLREILFDLSALDGAKTEPIGLVPRFDGRHYETLGRAAGHLADKWPAPATLLYRALVSSVLERGFSKGYKYAARDLSSAATAAKRLPTDNGISDHAAFVANLKSKHGRKYGFWTLITGPEPAAGWTPPGPMQLPRRLRR
jgi:hypothetical protein